jgi:ribonuclease BN (tRNA processing enzyme)
MRLTVVGCGDAFSSGGRFQPCFLLDAGPERVMIDCGATTLTALRRMGIKPESIDAVVLSHLHGDHFGGLPFLLLDLHFVSRRSRPLRLVGPQGTRERLISVMELLYPGIPLSAFGFTLDIIELPCEKPMHLGSFQLVTIAVDHPSGAPSTGLRIGHGGKIFAYSGDTGMTPALARLAEQADLFLIECYLYDQTLPVHLSFAEIEAARSTWSMKRLMLTHMSSSMLTHLDKVRDCLIAEDGLVVEI